MGLRQHRLVGIVWLTGISGAGKSSVGEVLKANGHHAIDADGDGFSRWVHRSTGEVVSDAPFPVPAGWLNDHAWRIGASLVDAARPLEEVVRDVLAVTAGWLETALSATEERVQLLEAENPDLREQREGRRVDVDVADAPDA